MNEESQRLEQIWGEVRQGSRRALAKAFSVLEAGNIGPVGYLTALAHPHAGKAHVVGVTGVPGVGKSTLTSALIREFRLRGQRVGVIAVDPSSPLRHGAVLGDRIRMQEHFEDQGVYIRSMATRGHLGGLCAAAPCGVVLLDAAGFDVVLVETVGVGQSEVALAGAADTVILALAPGLGDGVQADKAGIMEIADIFVINKSDHEGAGQVESTVTASIRLSANSGMSPARWTPPVHRTVAVRREGVGAVVDSVEAHRIALIESGQLTQRRITQARHLIEEVVLDRLRDKAHSDLGERTAGTLSSLAQRVAAHTLDPYAAAHLILSTWGSAANHG